MLDISNIMFKSSWKIITDTIFEAIPELQQWHGMTLIQNGGEEGTLCIASLHGRCILQTIYPLFVIFQQSQLKACLFECSTYNSIYCLYVIKRLCSFYNSEPGSKIKMLSRWGRGKVHSPNCKAMLPWFPLTCFLHKNKVLRKILIRDLSSTFAIQALRLSALALNQAVKAVLWAEVHSTTSSKASSGLKYTCCWSGRWMGRQ